MQATSILCLLPVLLVTVNFQNLSVNALNCVQCSALQESCTGQSMTCSTAEDSCRSLLGEGTMGILNSMSILKHCVASNLCSTGKATVTIGSSFTLRSAIECCMQDNCNSNKLTSFRKSCASVSPINTTLNGLQCPVCHAKDSVQCEIKETMSCAGFEDHCISMAGSLGITTDTSGPVMSFAMRGCATKSMCDMNKEVPVLFGLYAYKMSTVHSCTPATKSVNRANGISGTSSFGFFLPSLLFLKYLS